MIVRNTKHSVLSIVLSSGFNESIADATYTSPFPYTEAFVEDYDYESDSDLDDEEHEDGEKEEERVIEGESATALDAEKVDDAPQCKEISVEAPPFPSNGGVSPDTASMPVSSSLSPTRSLPLNRLQNMAPYTSSK